MAEDVPSKVGDLTPLAESTAEAIMNDDVGELPVTRLEEVASPATPQRADAPSKDTIEGMKEAPEDARLSVSLQTLCVGPSSGMSSVDEATRDVVTPPITTQLSPALISSLRGSSSSPAQSLVSAGSNPSAKPYDLTPVTRNTTSNELYADAKPITPGSGTDTFLHGEHLAMPADLSGPSVPPLQKLTSKSVSLQFSSQTQEDIPQPVQFPSRKFYSFTTREQYEEALRNDDDYFNASDSEDEEEVITPTLKPYQPTRNFDLETLGETELANIFTMRAAIPMEQRIPSLRMAEVLHGSTTSAFTDLDDEDSIIRDDASLSSRSSTLQHANDEGSSVPLVEETGAQQFDVAIAAGPLQEQQEHLGNARSADEEDKALQQRKQRKRKQRKKEKQAAAWLDSVQADQNVLAEAASSKFLTVTRPIAVRRQSSPAASHLRRQTSDGGFPTT